MLKYFLPFICIVIISLEVKAQETKKDYLKIGGALRFNIANQNYERSNKDLDTYIRTDTWYLTADAHKSGFDLSLQYRFYPDSKIHFIHHAYIGYSIDKEWYVKLGVFQKPFGISPSPAHSWWSQISYYMGLEDTYNTGIGFTYSADKFIVDAAYFRQAAPKGFMSSDGDNEVGNSRYSYAVVPVDSTASYMGKSANVRELDQFNVRVRYKINDIVEVGLSGQIGSIYNRALDKRSWGFTSAFHTVINYERWNLKAQAIKYNYNARADDNSRLDIIQMGAYGAAYDVAAKGTVYTTGVSYKIPVNRKFIHSIETYVDYSFVNKDLAHSHNTQFLIPGILITSGPVLTYIDFAMGKNQPWLTSNFGQGLGFGKPEARWNSRLNINIGYYF